jgi:acetoin utilization deacetylase AcuC-like enzyme
VSIRQPSASTALITHLACLEHETPAGHPENAARLRAVLDALSGDDFRALKRAKAPRAKLEMLDRVHDREFVRALLSCIPAEGIAMIDSDTALSPGSRDAALRAAGANVHAVNLVMSG